MNKNQIIRQPGDRRWEMQDEFPLLDRNGVYVVFERRSGLDRRQSTTSLKGMLDLLAQVTGRRTRRG